MEEIIQDSMCYDSETFIAEYREGNRSAYVMVQGDVKVYYKDTPYWHASEFPEELLEMFKTGKKLEGVEIVDNNWLEIFWEEDGYILDSDVFDVPTPIKMSKLMKYLKADFKEYFTEHYKGGK